MDLPSRLDLQGIGRDYVVQRATKIDPAQVDIIGSDVNVFVGSQSQVAYALVLQLAYAVNRLLLDGAELDDLDRYAWDRYQLPRKGASPARGTVRAYRATTTAGGGTIEIGTKLQTDSGIEYVTTAACTFAAADVSKTVTVRAVQAGKLTQVGKNQISKFSNVAALFDPTLLANNDAVTAGGEETEDDDTFRDRIRNFWNTARRGTIGAIEFGALAVPGVVSASAVEAISNTYPARVVFLYIADSSGVASDALADLVRQSLQDYRAAGIAVIVSTSLPQIATIQMAFTFQAGLDTVTLTDVIRSAVLEFVNSLPVNGSLYKGELFAVLKRFIPSGLILNNETIIAPAGDVVPVVGTTLRTTPQDIITN